MSDKCSFVSREGLYIMVFIILLQTCGMEGEFQKINKKISHSPCTNHTPQID